MESAERDGGSDAKSLQPFLGRISEQNRHWGDPQPDSRRLVAGEAYRARTVTVGAFNCSRMQGKTAPNPTCEAIA